MSLRVSGESPCQPICGCFKLHRQWIRLADSAHKLAIFGMVYAAFWAEDQLIYTMSRSNQKRILVGLALAFGVLMFVAFLMLASADQENKNAAAVVHTRDVLYKISELVAALSDAETGRRGFVLS